MQFVLYADLMCNWWLTVRPKKYIWRLIWPPYNNVPLEAEVTLYQLLNIPMFLKIVFDLLIQLRKAFKVNMTTNSVEVKVHISARHRHANIFGHNTTP